MKIGDKFYTLHLDDELKLRVEEEIFKDTFIPFELWSKSDRMRTFATEKEAYIVRDILLDVLNDKHLKRTDF